MEPTGARTAGANRPTSPDTSAGHDGAPAGPPRRPERTLSVLVLLAGVWLAVAPFLLDYRDTLHGFNASWNDIAVGTAIVVVAVARVIAPVRTAPLGAVLLALALWLVAAPFVLAYDDGPRAVTATWNDILTGVIVTFLSGVDWWAARRDRTLRPHARRR